MEKQIPSSPDRAPQRGGSNTLAGLVLGTGLVAGLLGLWRWNQGREIKPDVAAVAPTVAIAPTPTMQPSPTPNPVVQRHRIPAWAKGKVLSEVPVRPGEKVFALTFDDGPWPESTRQILQILAANNVKATFYMVGSVVREYPKIAQSVRDGGHVIGNHSWSHPSRPRNPVAEVQRTDAEIKRVLGFTPTSFRPPYGLLKNGLARQAMRENDPVLLWSADSNDWARPGVSRIVSHIVNEASPGGIALMHDGGGNRSQTVAALPVIIDTLRGQGYRFVTIPELLALRYVAPPAPRKPKTVKVKKTAAAP